MGKKWILCVIFGLGWFESVIAEDKVGSSTLQVTLSQKETEIKKYDFDTLALLDVIKTHQKDYQKLQEGPYALSEVSVRVLPRVDSKSPVIVQFIFLAKKVVSPMNSERAEYQGERKWVVNRTEDQSWQHDSEEMPVYRYQSLGVLQTKKPKNEGIVPSKLPQK